MADANCSACSTPNEAAPGEAASTTNTSSVLSRPNTHTDGASPVSARSRAGQAMTATTRSATVVHSLRPRRSASAGEHHDGASVGRQLCRQPQPTDDMATASQRWIQENQVGGSQVGSRFQ